MYSSADESSTISENLQCSAVLRSRLAFLKNKIYIIHTLYLLFKDLNLQLKQNISYQRALFLFFVHCPSGMRCHVLNLIPHGRYTCTQGFAVDSRCDFTCDPGYRIDGEHSRTCQHGGSWSGAQPVCAGINQRLLCFSVKADQMFNTRSIVCVIC